MRNRKKIVEKNRDFFGKKHESTGKNRLLKKCAGLSYPPRFFWVLFDIYPRRRAKPSNQPRKSLHWDFVDSRVRFVDLALEVSVHFTVFAFGGK
jgi:hypothetical protein